MALVGVALHEPFDVAGMHVEFVLQDAARPDRPGLLIFRHADALAAQVGGHRDARIGAHDDAGVEELAHGEDRDRHPAGIAARHRDDQRRHRHLGDVEFGEAQLPPEHLGRMHHGGDEPDPLRRDTAFEQRPRALVVGERDTELEVGSGHDWYNSVQRRAISCPALTLRSARDKISLHESELDAHASRRVGRPHASRRRAVRGSSAWGEREVGVNSRWAH